MISCQLVLHGDLPELAGGHGRLTRRLPAPTSAKDALEAVGIPHVELGPLTLDDAPATRSTLVTDGTTLAAWPTEPASLDEPRFLCDLHLGKLARLLRFAGLDTAWDPDLREAGLTLLAAREDRVVLSRHRALLKRSQVTHGLLVRRDRPDDQLVEVLRRYRLASRLTQPGRCTACNGPLAATPRDQVPGPIPPRTAAWLDEYWICRECGHLFWEGTHVERLRRRLARVVRAASGA